MIDINKSLQTGNENRRIEEDLRQSRARLDRGEMISKTGNWELHLDKQIMLGSNGAKFIYNIQDSEWNLADIQQFPLAEYRSLLDNALRRLIENNEPYNVEFKIKQAGTGKILDIHSLAEYDKDKNVIFGVIQDITDRKKTEASLYEAKELFFSVFNLCPLPILLSSLTTGKYLDANQIFYDVLEYSPKDVIGRTSAEIGVFVNYADRETLVSTVRQHGAIIGLECLLYTKSKTIKSCLVSIATVMRGGERCLLTSFIDITDRKRMEEELQRSQKLESLGLLAGGIAHDFNNLLTGIFGYVELARSVSNTTKAIDYLNTTIATINRARALTQQLLTFAKGGFPVQKSASLIPVVQDAVRFALSGSNISSHFSFAQNLWQCNIDKNQIGQVIDNIVINAQQAMPNGGVIEVMAENIAFGVGNHAALAAGNFVKLSILDSGIGIPKEILRQIFDPFFTTKTKGHGLGLATCYSIVKKHGGCIDVESEPGKGSIFHIFLPAATSQAPAEIPTNFKHEGIGTILIVDDEKVIQSALEKLLGMMGYKVECKDDGRAGVDFFANETRAGRRISAIFLDLTIPGGMGGIEAIKEIRNIDKAIPAFVISGYSDDSVMRNPFEYGFTASICKPFTIEELSEMLNKHMRP
jgi:PAS domain S-box-containing protein